MRIVVLMVRVEYELTDEGELRDSAVAAGVDGDCDSGDTVARLLLLKARERLTLPGTRLLATTMTRDYHLEG
jgi:hypothetical protein